MATEHVTTDRAKDPHAVNVAHHFESAQQQFDAGKLGMWLFLVTEVLFFSGLFVAYAVYRVNHPEVFVDAHRYLNTTLGAFNTIVLLVSSLTMALAVRSAQLSHKKALIWLLTATLACASLFLGVKAVEYSHKWDEGLLWAGAYTTASAKVAAERVTDGDHHANAGHHSSNFLLALSAPALLLLAVSAAAYWLTHSRRRAEAKLFWTCLLLVGLAFFIGVGIGQSVEYLAKHSADSSVADTKSAEVQAETTVASRNTTQLTGVFFSIYYAMTGVHAIHILAGMGVIAWLLRRAIRGHFNASYFGPVDYVGLYWHVVDLVWIYLFPLLYLIR